MEKGEFHLGISSKEEVGKEQEVYKPGIQRSLHQSLKGFALWPRLCICTASTNKSTQSELVLY